LDCKIGLFGFSGLPGSILDSFLNSKSSQNQDCCEKSHFWKNAQNIAPVSKNQGFSCQEGIKMIENCEENRLKNSIFENALLKTTFFPFCSSFRSLGAPVG